MVKQDVTDRPTAFLLEVLELRITPANFFLAPDGNVTDSSGQDVNIASLATDVGTAKAILLKKGDSLIFDANGDGVFNKKTDTNLFQVKGGASYLFLDDVIGSDATPLDITGVAATTKFSAVANADVLGDIATMTTVQGSGKNANYQFNEAIIADATITGFTSGHKVSGSILAGGDISKIAISGQTDGYSVFDIRAGTGVGGNASVDLGGTNPIAVTNVTVADGAKGASISSVTLTGGAHLIAAGDGGAVSNPTSKLKGGDGGSISKISSALGGDITLIAGAGGSSAIPAQEGTASKFGGFGGSVTDIKLSSANDEYGITIIAGDSGMGGKSMGGGIEKLTLLGNTLGAVSLSTGDGSYSYLGAGNAGGDGGSLKKISIAATTLKGFSVSTGNGGDGGLLYSGTALKGGGDGGNSGSLGNFSIGFETGDLAMIFGNGGSAGGKFSGGSGNSIENLTFRLTEGADVTLVAGSGGSGWKSVGTGGSINNITLDSDGDLGVVTLTAGNGGSASALVQFESTQVSQANGGAGGSISNIITTGSLAGLNAKAGSGGNAAYVQAIDFAKIDLRVKLPTYGGAGGAISNIDATLTGDSQFIAGNSGTSSNVASQSGQVASALAGGSISNLELTSLNSADVRIVAGAGGKSSIVSGIGGSLTDLTLGGTDFGNIELRAGSGGSGDISDTGTYHTEGASAGTFNGISVSGTGGGLHIFGGNGGNGALLFAPGTAYGTTGAHGASVSQNGFSISASLDSLSVTGGSGGAGTASGEGGYVSGWEFTTDIGEISLIGGAGGVGTELSRDGGSVTDIKFTSGHFNKVTLAGGKGNDGIPVAGSGIQFPGSDVGNGGTIERIAANANTTFGELSLLGGDGGNGVDDLNVIGNRTGGNGGGIGSLNLAGEISTLIAHGGNGGNGQVRGDDSTTSGGGGGNGGVVVSLVASHVDTLDARGGDGGNSFGRYSAGNGGGVSGITATVVESAQIESGNGGEGSAFSNFKGGSGGLISNVTLQSGASLASEGAGVSIQAGNGGANADSTGADGGEVTYITLNSGKFGTVEITAGNGGDALSYGSGGGNGGAGGAMRYFTFGEAASANTISLNSGDGGNGVNVGSSKAGNGGEMNTLGTAGQVTNLSLIAGDGGDGGLVSTGSGGSIGLVGNSVNNPIANLTLSAGNAGNGIGGVSGAASAGWGGTIGSAYFVFSETASLTTGDGGSTISGIGGRGGNISATEITSVGSDATASIVLGSGGDGYSSGGTGGSIYMSVEVTGPLNSLDISTGSGGNATNGKGGDGGSYSSTQLSAAIKDVLLSSGNGGDGVNGGNGGAFKYVSLGIEGDVTNLNLISGNGGNGTQNGGDGGNFDYPFGYAGGPVPHAIVNAVVSSGNGGNGITGTGGQGGDINILNLTPTNSLITHPGSDGTGAV